MREEKKASSFAIFSIANVLAFVRVLATIFAYLVSYYPVDVANVTRRDTTYTVSKTILPTLVTTLPELITTLPTLVANLPTLVTTMPEVIT